MSDQKKKRDLVKYDKFNPNLLAFTSIDFEDERNKKGKQFLSYSRYQYPTGNDGSFVFVTPKITMTQHGIPNLGEWYPSDKDRCFVKVPLDPNQPECVKLEEMLASVDARAKEQLRAILGDKFDSYEYQSVIHEPADFQDDDTSSKKKKTDKKCNYFKAKFDIDFETEKFATKAYYTDQTEIQCSSTTDVAKVLRFNSSGRFIIMVNKFWASKTAVDPKDRKSKKKCGIGMKVMQIEIEPSKAPEAIREQFNSNAFGDSDEDDSTTTTTTTASSTTGEESVDADEASSESEEEEEEEPEPEPVKVEPVKSKKAAAPAPVAPAKKTTSKAKAAGKS